MRIHFDVLDELESKWSRWDVGRAGVMGIAEEMQRDIRAQCDASHVSPAYLLSIGFDGTIRGDPVQGAERFKGLCGTNPLLLATLQLVCEQSLDVEACSHIIAKLKRAEAEVLADSQLSDQARINALRSALRKTAGGLSACRVVAQVALGNQGTPQATTSADSVLTLMLASVLDMPHPMESILLNFVADAMRYRGERNIVRARARSVLCARFESDLPALELVMGRLEQRFDLASENYHYHLEDSGKESKATRAAHREQRMFEVASHAAQSAWRYLERGNATLRLDHQL